MLTHDYMQEIGINNAYRLLNFGAAMMVRASFEGDSDAMPASFACALGLFPSKVSVVVTKDHYTRDLIEKSGTFALGLPTVSIVKELLYLGSYSKHDHPSKLADSQAHFFTIGDSEIPLMDGCLGFLICKVIDEPAIRDKYDLILGEVTQAFADRRVYSEENIDLSKVGYELHPVHYLAGQHFYAMGDEINPQRFAGVRK